MLLDPKIPPPGPLHEKWDNCRFSNKLVSPTNCALYAAPILFMVYSSFKPDGEVLVAVET